MGAMSRGFECNASNLPRARFQPSRRILGAEILAIRSQHVSPFQRVSKLGRVSWNGGDPLACVGHIDLRVGAVCRTPRALPGQVTLKNSCSSNHGALDPTAWAAEAVEPGQRSSSIHSQCYNGSRKARNTRPVQPNACTDFHCGCRPTTSRRQVDAAGAA